MHLLILSQFRDLRIEVISRDDIGVLTTVPAGQF